MSQLPILYSFRRCPYAMRARLAIRASGQQVEHREVLLKNKPQSLIDYSKKATVPILVLSNDQVIDESLSIMLWALKICDPENMLAADKSKCLKYSLEIINETEVDFKYWLDRYKYSDRYHNYTMLESRNKAEKFLQKINLILINNNFLAGEKITLLDIAIAPFIRQFASVDKEWFYSSQYSKVIAWLDVFIHSELFESIMKKYPYWQD